MTSLMTSLLEGGGLLGLQLEVSAGTAREIWYLLAIATM